MQVFLLFAMRRFFAAVLAFLVRYFLLHLAMALARFAAARSGRVGEPGCPLEGWPGVGGRG